MTDSLTVSNIMEVMEERLGLTWVAGTQGGGRSISHRSTPHGSPSLVGHLNIIHPNQIQVLGNDEMRYLWSLRKNSQRDILEQLCSGASSMLIVTDNLEPLPELRTLSERQSVPLLRTALPSHELINILRYFFSNKLAETTTLHGVFMEVLGIGVLLTGDSAVGKSELALELISRGHRLVADDAPEFARIAPDILRGTCPPVLENFLEVRGLGVLNVKAMYGDSAIKNSKYLRLIIDLKDQAKVQAEDIDRLHGVRYTRVVLGLEIPVITLPVAPGRNLAVMVEGAIRNHLLRLRGYYAGDDLAGRQRKQMQSESP
ncbi:HPr(Ser) kinase/phosphatase [Ectothiorhodospira variabilis]|uniref:HPr(Ser) kinase/phosphatase n=1 Tax=Ectothiorhodospira variabilis TaxID=505694 RepID=UPI001EFB1B7B|nr:HPr(Ser) kinase/phosphatase [Ectothiorhodospira variabilis]MCG5493440.1 HPr(Ser) kinase/phosphatase [Ectothiorhodospira variabilis]MCG5502769.1 HPr(Ser) kinase/phosphatase [Ectothiorhodospira variabilis]MCG5505465.1 HPr(Ser) kinase/phosphatase [Ectothiorhodospira variabilis]